MPALPPVNKVVRIDWHYKDDADLTALCRYFASYSGVLSIADAQTWVNGIAAAWGGPGHLQGNVFTGLTLTKVELTDLTTSTSPQVSTLPGFPGTAGPPGVTGGVAYVLSFKMLRRYRGGHPRMYIPGLPFSAAGTAQTWTSAALANTQNAARLTITDGISSQPPAVGITQHVNVSYFQGFHNVTYPSCRIRPVPTVRAVPLVDVITGYVGNPNIASQRRRNLQP
jgi:hypothetical protein